MALMVMMVLSVVVTGFFRKVASESVVTLVSVMVCRPLESSSVAVSQEAA